MYEQLNSNEADIGGEETNLGAPTLYATLYLQEVRVGIGKLTNNRLAGYKYGGEKGASLRHTQNLG